MPLKLQSPFNESIENKKTSLVFSKPVTNPEIDNVCHKL